MNVPTYFVTTNALAIYAGDLVTSHSEKRLLFHRDVIERAIGIHSFGKGFRPALLKAIAGIESWTTAEHSQSPEGIAELRQKMSSVFDPDRIWREHRSRNRYIAHVEGFNRASQDLCEAAAVSAVEEVSILCSPSEAVFWEAAGFHFEVVWHGSRNNHTPPAAQELVKIETLRSAVGPAVFFAVLAAGLLVNAMGDAVLRALERWFASAPPLLVATVTTTGGLLLYLVRRYQRLLYGLIELLVAIFLGLQAYPQEAVRSYPTAYLSFIASFYIFVRGIDNIATALGPTGFKVLLRKKRRRGSAHQDSGTQRAT